MKDNSTTNPIKKDSKKNILKKNTKSKTNLKDKSNTKSKTNTEDKKSWEALYNYVLTDVMGYKKGVQSLSKTMVLRLKGVRNGKYMANKSVKSVSEYSYVDILNTFKFCKSDITRCFRNVDIKDEMHKFNLALKIVGNNLNEVYMRCQKNNQLKKQLENIKLNNLNDNNGGYKKKTTDNLNKRLNNLW